MLEKVIPMPKLGLIRLYKTKGKLREEIHQPISVNAVIKPKKPLKGGLVDAALIPKKARARYA
jgi:hypothetical protein